MSARYPERGRCSACQAAKEAGRNRVHSFEANDIDLMRRRREIQWAARINSALEDNRFELFRQTILPLQEKEDGEHYELLLRMRDESPASLVVARSVHFGSGTLRHYAERRPLGCGERAALAGFRGG